MILDQFHIFLCIYAELFVAQPRVKNAQYLEKNLTLGILSKKKKLLKPDRYNIMIYDQLDQEVITAMKSITSKDVINLGKNYGWTL